MGNGVGAGLPEVERQVRRRAVGRVAARAEDGPVVLDGIAGHVVERRRPEPGGCPHVADVDDDRPDPQALTPASPRGGCRRWRSRPSTIGRVCCPAVMATRSKPSDRAGPRLPSTAAPDPDPRWAGRTKKVSTWRVPPPLPDRARAAGAPPAAPAGSRRAPRPPQRSRPGAGRPAGTRPGEPVEETGLRRGSAVQGALQRQGRDDQGVVGSGQTDAGLARDGSQARAPGACAASPPATLRCRRGRRARPAPSERDRDAPHPCSRSCTGMGDRGLLQQVPGAWPRRARWQGAQAAQPLDRHGVRLERCRVVDEGVGHLVVARRAHVEQLADGLLLGAGVLPPLPLEGDDLAVAVAEPGGCAGDPARVRRSLSTLRCPVCEGNYGPNHSLVIPPSGDSPTPRARPHPSQQPQTGPGEGGSATGRPPSGRSVPRRPSCRGSR